MSVAGLRPNSIAQRLVDLSGEAPATASLLKMIGNVLILNLIETVAELHAFAEKSGLRVQSLNEVIASLFPDSLPAVYSQRMVSGAYCQGTVCQTLACTSVANILLGKTE